MPANLTPDYLEAERRYREAKTYEEKLAALEDMLRFIPKHKGTEKLQAWIKRKIAETKNAITSQRKRAGKKGLEYNVPKEGAGQVVLVGPPNSGKSSIIASLTNATPEVADYPFTTQKPAPAMMDYENTKIQLVDLPPVSRDFFEGWLAGIVRNADACALVFDLASDDLLDDIDIVLGRFRNAKILFVRSGKPHPGPDGFMRKTTVVLANKCDDEFAPDRLEILKEALADTDLPIIVCSTRTGEGLEEFRNYAFEMLGVIRVYTKAPGKKPMLDNPVILPKGSTVLDFAEEIHQDFVKKLKFARIFGRGDIDGMMVNREFVLQDGDIVELHI